MISRRARGAALAAVVVLVAAGCGSEESLSSSPDLTRGKQLFVNGDAKKYPHGLACGACHTLAGAGTSGTTGPNLDAAFAYVHSKGSDARLETSGIRSVVLDQIRYASGAMPRNLVTGQDAQDVAAYVAQAVSGS
ncbi:MAG: c-type cytochrome [Gaiellaceae bacterium]